MQDITRRKRTEEELRHRQALLGRLARQLSISEEGQRRAIAEDLHDSVTQLLGISLFRLRNLGADLADPHQAAEADQICRDLDQALTHTRTLTIEISPPSLYDLGLGPPWNGWPKTCRNAGAWRWIISGTEAVAVSTKTSGLPCTGQPGNCSSMYTSMPVYRVHGWRCSGRTDAYPFPCPTGEAGSRPGRAASCQTEDGFGLLSIRERIELLGGEMEIKAAPGHGCCITLYAPLTGPERKEAKCP